MQRNHVSITVEGVPDERNCKKKLIDITEKAHDQYDGVTAL